MSLLTIRQKFNPTKIGGCKLWLDASSLVLDGVADGGAVTTWRDLSGNGHNAAQSTADNKPTLQTVELAGRPVVRFDGSNDRLEFSGSGLSIARNVTGVTIIATLKPSGTGAERFAVNLNNNAAGVTRASLSHTATTWRAGGRRLDADSFSNDTQGTPANGTTVVATALHGYSTATVQMWVNGASDGATTVSGWTGSSSDTASSTARIGANNTSQYWSGDIAEVVIYNRPLGAGERAVVERYLGRKYGVAVI